MTETRIPINRPDWNLTGADIVKLHQQNKPVPLTQYTVVIQRVQKMNVSTFHEQA